MNYTNIIKATPTITLVYADTHKCQKRNLAIFSNWVKYFTTLSKFQSDLNFKNIFEYINVNIFNNYFNAYHVNFCPLEKAQNNNYSDILLDILKIDRYENNRLKYPEDNEYISYIVNYNVIDIFYFPEEISNLEKTIPQSDRQNIHLAYPPKFSQYKGNIVDNLDINSIHVNINEKNDLVSSDRRFVVLGAHRPLFNSTIDTSVVNHFNSTLYGVGQSLINISLIIFHAMLHIKCELEHKNHRKHTDGFLNEYINFLPSVLFGHALLPRVTI